MEASSAALKVRAMLGLGALAAVVGVVLFGGAGTLRYPEAWVFLSIFFGASLTVTLYLMRRDPKLLERTRVERHCRPAIVAESKAARAPRS